MFRSTVARLTGILMILSLLATLASASPALAQRRTTHHRTARCTRTVRHDRRHHRTVIITRCRALRHRAIAKAADASASGTNSFGKSLFGVAAGGSLQSEPAGQLATDLTADQAVGAKFLRTDINWAQIQGQGPSSFDWTLTDNVVKGAKARGMQILGVIMYTPSWDRPAGSGPTYHPDPAAYARFARAAAAHYAAMGVHSFEIWNEENTPAFWSPSPSPADYAALLQAAYPAIHAGDPSATVITGGLAPATTDGTNFSPVDFLSGVYGAGAQGSFDAVGAHPYCWPAMPGAADSWSAWYQMYGTSTSLRSLMVAHGDGAKKIWGTEFGAPTNGPAGSFVSQATQAQMIGTAFKLWSGYSWAGPLFIYQGRDQGTDTSTRENFFGFLNHDGTPKLGFFAYRQAAALY